MSTNNDTPIQSLGLVSLVKIPERGFVLTSRSFTCPPGFLYCVFRNTSAGPEFIQSFGPNQKGSLEKEQDIYRVSMGGAPARHEFQESFTMLDGTKLEIATELNIKIADGAKVARSVVQDRIDPLKRFCQDVVSLLDDEIASLEYEKVFIPENKEITLKNRDLEEKIKQKSRATDYGLVLDAIRIKVIIPPELKKRWDNDIASWQTSEAKKTDIERRRKEVELKKEINKLTSEENRLDAELDAELEKIKTEQSDSKTQRTRQKEDDAIERERKLRKDEERERQNEIRSETDHRIEIQNVEQRAKFEQETAEQRQQLYLETEKRIHDRNESIEILRHKVNENQITEQLEQFRRRQEEFERVHQLRLARLQELADLQFEQMKATQQLNILKIQEEQKLLLASSQQTAELQHQYKLLEFKEKEIVYEVKAERARLENQEIHEERLARIQLGKDLVKARLELMERVSTGESNLTPEQIQMLIGINPINDKTISRDQIASLVDAIDEYLTSDNGTEKIRNVLHQLSDPNKPMLTIDEKSHLELPDGQSSQTNAPEKQDIPSSE